MDTGRDLEQQAYRTHQSILGGEMAPAAEQPEQPQTFFAPAPTEPPTEPDLASPWSALVAPGLAGRADPIGPTDNGPHNYTRPDAFILDDVAKVLAWDPTINAFDLDVNCTDGHVLVSGIVPLISARRRLEALLASVLGVRAISIEDVVVSKGVEPIPESEHEERHGETVEEG